MPPVHPEPATECPVDPQTREKWLQAAKTQRQQVPPNLPPTPPVKAIIPPTAEDLRKAENSAPQLEALGPRILQLSAEQRHTLLTQYQSLKTLEFEHQLGRTKYSLDQLRWIPATSPFHQSQTDNRHAPRIVRPALSTEREVSSIPRATNHDRQTLNSAEAAALPANSERDTGHDKDSGKWIYPSQSMFFAAMKRKGHSPSAPDMETIVPIHNAVNERAWAEIKAWEEGRGSEVCGGPKLVSFAGDSKALTPRARWNRLLGYEAPFDRHDWVVDRCGKKVEYVIDFYAGRGSETGGGGTALSAGNGPLSFYLDVRPKLNSWEGVKTRASRTVGM